MSEAELIFTALAELSLARLQKQRKLQAWKKIVASKKWGTIAKQARKKLENQIGKSVLTNQNFYHPRKSKGFIFYGQ